MNEASAPRARFFLSLATLAQAFPLPWSAYVRLVSLKNPNAHSFYEAEALRGGWSVRELDCQIGSQSYAPADAAQAQPTSQGSA